MIKFTIDKANCSQYPPVLRILQMSARNPSLQGERRRAELYLQLNVISPHGNCNYPWLKICWFVVFKLVCTTDVHVWDFCF